jgi:stage II sporulation protein AA (anti-sigma F factor antagonist)
MPVSGSVKERSMTLRMTGEVDHHQARSLMMEIDQRIDLTLPRQLTLDLSGVTFMDSSGIAVLLRAWRRMRELEGKLQVVGVPEQAAKVLQAAGLERIIPIQKEN